MADKTYKVVSKNLMLLSLWFSRALLIGLWKGNITHDSDVFVYVMDRMLEFC